MLSDKTIGELPEQDAFERAAGYFVDKALVTATPENEALVYVALALKQSLDRLVDVLARDES